MRRSSASSKLPLLPLDLHVLSLPLAFILSQDQTLHRLSLNIILKQYNGIYNRISLMFLVFILRIYYK